MAAFRLGDVVQLKSGGPNLTVDSFVENSDEVVCSWLILNDATRCKAHFPAAYLRHISSS